MVKRHKLNLRDLNFSSKKFIKEITSQNWPRTTPWIEDNYLLGKKLQCANSIQRGLLAKHSYGRCSILSEADLWNMQKMIEGLLSWSLIVD